MRVLTTSDDTATLNNPGSSLRLMTLSRSLARCSSGTDQTTKGRSARAIA